MAQGAGFTPIDPILRSPAIEGLASLTPTSWLPRLIERPDRTGSTIRHRNPGAYDLAGVRASYY